MNGRSADHWEFSDDCFVWRSKDRLIEIKVPVAHLVDEAMMSAHFGRLTACAPAYVLDELDDIVEGARQ